MEALGFTMTQLLRHSHRGPDHRYDRSIPGLVDLEWQSDASLSVVQVVEQPGCRLLQATPPDVKAYVELMNRETTDIDPRDKRFVLKDDPGGARVKAVQGHSQTTLNAVRLTSGVDQEKLGTPYRSEESPEQQDQEPNDDAEEESEDVVLY